MADRKAEDSAAPKAGEAPPALTVAELRDLIREHALRGPKGRETKLRMPADEALAELAATVNHWAEKVRQAEAETEEYEDWRKVGEAAAILRERLPIIGRRLKAQEERGDSFAERQLREMMLMFLAVENFAPPPQTVWRDEGVRDMPVPDWRVFARVVLADLEAAFGQKLGRHDSGPAARLSAALFQRVTGDEITSARIGEVLRSRK